MIGHREKLIDGDERDVTSRRARRVVRLRRGEAPAVKRRMTKRARKEVRESLRLSDAPSRQT